MARRSRAELIGYDPKTKRFSSLVFSKTAPTRGPTNGASTATTSRPIRKNPMNATFTGKFAPDGKSSREPGGQIEVPTSRSMRHTT